MKIDLEKRIKDFTNKDLSDKDIADILTYVYGSWGNNKTKITIDMVKKQRTKK